MSSISNETFSSGNSELSDPPSDIDQRSWPSSPATTPPRPKKGTKKPAKPRNLSPKPKRETRSSSNLTKDITKPNKIATKPTSPAKITKNKSKKGGKSNANENANGSFTLAIARLPIAPDQIAITIANTKVRIFGDVSTAQKIWEHRHKYQNYMEEDLKDTELRTLRESAKYWGMKARGAKEEVQKLNVLGKERDELIEKRDMTIALLKRQLSIAKNQGKA